VLDALNHHPPTIIVTAVDNRDAASGGNMIDDQPFGDRDTAAVTQDNMVRV
jgi:hypothetical protein